MVQCGARRARVCATECSQVCASEGAGCVRRATGGASMCAKRQIVRGWWCEGGRRRVGAWVRLSRVCASASI